MVPCCTHYYVFTTVSHTERKAYRLLSPMKIENIMLLKHYCFINSNMVSPVCYQAPLFKRRSVECIHTERIVHKVVVSIASKGSKYAFTHQACNQKVIHNRIWPKYQLQTPCEMQQNCTWFDMTQIRDTYPPHCQRDTPMCITWWQLTNVRCTFTSPCHSRVQTRKGLGVKRITD